MATETYQVIKDYRKNDELRNSFNELAKQTFGLQFEDWYQNGYWQDQYNPYSIVTDGRVVANVSVNTTDFILNGVRKHFIQLGTVMTEASYRNRGLIRQIMNEIERDYHDTDGMYLFANDSVLDFYPKFGFRKAHEYQYSKQVSVEGPGSMVQIPMQEKKAWDRLEAAIRESACYSPLELVDNSALIMFYVTKFMQENVYYDKSLDVFAIAEILEDHLLLYNVFSANQIDLDAVINAFGRKIKQVTLKFTPLTKDGYTLSELREEDTTLFVKGSGFHHFEENKMMIPALAHA